MGSASDDRDLGMHRRIPRRDFVNGIAIGITGAYAAASAPTLAALGRAIQPPAGSPSASDAAAYPPARMGLRGDYPSAVEDFGPIREGAFSRTGPATADPPEAYDLVIVGGGISGLAAAYFWRRALPNQRVLIVDNHDDFGGHAKRNEFTFQGRTFIGYGGTMGIATPYPYSYTAKALVSELGVQVERNSEFFNRDLFNTYHLGPATFFDKEHFGEDRLVRRGGKWEQFFGDAPLTSDARRDLIRLHRTNPDYLAGLTVEQKIAKLERISYQDYLLKIAHMSPDALPFFMGQGGRNNKRVDTTPALEAARRGSPGFDGLGLDVREEFNEGSYTFHFPDGNASIARLLVNRLVPAALPGKQTMTTIVQAPLDYRRLDEPGASTRIRLRSTVVRVEHDGPGDDSRGVHVTYRRDGAIHRVRGRNCILACYNALIPHLVPELPARQKEALQYGVKVPMMYNNVLIRRWTAFQQLGVASISAPGMYHTTTSIDTASTIGGYRAVTTPDEPVVLHLVRNPNTPGLPRKEQNRMGQQELLSTTYEQYEREIRRQLGRMLAAGGFDPAADIAAITVNRWPYGYAYTYDTLGDPDVPPEQRPHVVGRQRFGSMAIANADAGAAAFTNQAIDEAHRAVQELLVSRGLT
jgi:spermidine dehydrogenase